MQRGNRANKPLSAQIRKHASEREDKKPFEGNTETMISTGSTLLDLAISGKRKRGGGVPGGILLEAFGPNGSGKTVLLCEIGGAIQRQGGSILFNDPEARLNSTFAELFDLDMSRITLEEPDTVSDMITGIQKWEPVDTTKVNGCLTDSLAALSTNMEMDGEDKMGMRRAKEFSEGLRKICRIIKQNNYIIACSNQIRENADAIGYGERFSVPGGKAVGFYASVRLRFHTPEKIRKKKTFAGKEITKVVAIKTKVEVYKNSCDEPYRTADVYIDFQYGIDDVRANLQFVKDYTSMNTYGVNGESLGISLERAVIKVEEQGLEQELREQVIDLWEQIQKSFEVKRKKKVRV